MKPHQTPNIKKTFSAEFETCHLNRSNRAILLRDSFMAVIKSRKHCGFVIYSYFKQSAFVAVKRDVKF